MGVFFIAFTGCENETPVEALSEQKEALVLDQIEQSLNVDDTLPIKERRKLKPGKITPPVVTEKIREQFKELGRDPNSIVLGTLSDKGSWLVGKEAREKFKEDWAIDPKPIGEKTQSRVQSVESVDEEVIIQGSATPATTDFMVVEISNPPASGSVTVDYEGDQVTTNYSSYMGASQVAYVISSNY